MATYWTLQTEIAWKHFKEQGYLEGSPAHAMYPDEYQWMMKQMKKRLSNYRGEHPIWLWMKKPDMRHTGHFQEGTRCVRLTIELNKGDVLVSDFDDWHFVLNNWFCSDNEQEDSAFEKGLLKISKEVSWERIFELNRVRDPKWHGDGERILQGTTGRIEIHHVKIVEHFVTR
ncbi:DUF3841 domain-containing protein [Brevibacillus antibioticus]|uniref:DUF3841 domain-containing protein n=1 Tax=Brevibacillus antibioticus TaxID=2570228 RepID=A0A4U2Y9H3_9BACL|nr:DUF3841 domain-containing protein [Brevibacillus antibioticus]TKI55941.1 DUF3841 domain-containing protein [Brevibacillus antibioticus]